MINSDKIKTFEFIDPCLCSAWVATAVVGSAAIGGISQSYAASKAADAQTAAADKSIALQQNQYAQTRSDLAPYRDIGGQAATDLSGRLNDLTTGAPVPTAPAPLTQAELEATPGYQWTLAQGQKGVTNSAAARGLATSGAALKGAATFATGLSDSTYNTRFNQRQQEFGNQQQIYSDVMQNKSAAYDRLAGLINTGAGAAGATGTLGEKAAYNSGVATVGAGNAQAAADNKIGTAIASTANGIGGYTAYKGIYGGGSSGGSGPITYGTPNGPTAFS